jgi:hypothetical protein
LSAGTSEITTLDTATARLPYVAAPASAATPNQSPGPRISTSRAEFSGPGWYTRTWPLCTKKTCRAGVVGSNRAVPVVASTCRASSEGRDNSSSTAGARVAPSVS